MKSLFDEEIRIFKSLEADRGFFSRIAYVLYVSDKMDWLFHGIYYPILGFFANIKRLVRYAPIVWRHRNWDHSFILKFELELYKDLKKGLVEGNAFHDHRTLDSLDAVIKLLERLEDGTYYEDIARKNIEATFGIPEYTFEKYEDDRFFRIKNSILENMTGAEQKEYWDYVKEEHAAAERAENADMIELHEIIRKNRGLWWD